MSPTVAVAIPSIPPRRDLLTRALDSVAFQTAPAIGIAVAIDHAGAGAAATRNTAAAMAIATGAKYLAFLDDDDEFQPEHLEKLVAQAEATWADMVYSWYTIVLPDGTPHTGDDILGGFGDHWDPAHPIQTTITCLWRVSAFEGVGGFPLTYPNMGDSQGNRIGEDYLIVEELNRRGGKIVHLPEKTWLWHHHGKNLSGQSWTRLKEEGIDV
jgi:glycosyltransferase involved in cell wall biosynthesis